MQANVFYLTFKIVPSKKQLLINHTNLNFIKIEKDNFLLNLMAKLVELQIQSVIIEGGSNTLQQFIDENLWDETIIIKNNIIS